MKKLKTTIKMLAVMTLCTLIWAACSSNEKKPKTYSMEEEGEASPTTPLQKERGEMEEGEGIAHSTACKISKDPDLQPAFRYVGRSVRVDVAKLHELQRKKAAEKNKPISNNPRRNKKTPTL